MKIPKRTHPKDCKCFCCQVFRCVVELNNRLVLLEIDRDEFLKHRHQHGMKWTGEPAYSFPPIDDDKPTEAVKKVCRTCIVGVCEYSEVNSGYCKMWKPKQDGNTGDPRRRKR